MGHAATWSQFTRITPGEWRALLARFQRRTVELLEVIDQGGQLGAGQDR